MCIVKRFAMFSAKVLIYNAKYMNKQDKFIKKRSTRLSPNARYLYHIIVVWQLYFPVSK